MHNRVVGCDAGLPDVEELAEHHALCREVDFCGLVHDENAHKIEPTVIYPATLDCAAMQQEIFGPILPVLTYSTDDELIKIIDEHPTPLAFYLFTSKTKNEKSFFLLYGVYLNGRSIALDFLSTDL